MPAYVVTYDLNRPGQKYAALIAELRRLNSCYTQKSMWLVEVNQTPIQLRNALDTYLDQNDRLWVSQIFKGTWASFNMDDAALWLDDRGLL